MIIIISLFFLQIRVDAAFEAGLFSNWKYNTMKILMGRLQEQIKVYQSLEDYITEFSNTNNTSGIILENLSTIFFCFFGFLALLSSLFFGHSIRLVPRLRVVLSRAVRATRHLVRNGKKRLKLIRLRVRLRISRV